MPLTVDQELGIIENWVCGWSETVLCVGLLYPGVYVLDLDGIQTTISGPCRRGRYVEMNYPQINAVKLIPWGTLVAYDRQRHIYQIVNPESET